MQVSSINYYGYSTGKTNFRNNNHINRKNTVSIGNSLNRMNVYRISFGSLEKERNMNQVLEFTPENSGLGLKEAKLGGEGVVGFELGESLNHELVNGKEVDDRRIMPIWSHNNPEGGFKFLVHKGISRKELGENKKYKEMPDKLFISGKIGETLEDKANNLNISTDEIDYVIQSKPNGSGPEALSKYCIIEPTSAKGTVLVPSPTGMLGEMKVMPYQLMKISENNPSYNEFEKRSHNYFLYTPELARTSKPYSYDCFGNTPFEAEITSSNGMRAIAKILEKDQMNTKDFEYFRPASFIAHDRPASTLMNHIANLSSEGHEEINGLKIHKVEHNPSFDYQGKTGDPFKMFQVVADEKDMEALREHPNYDIVNKAFKYGINSSALTDEEKQIAKTVIEPFVAPFKDYFGNYNITKIPIVGVKNNPQNMSLGSVSWHFDAEMKSPETPDTAKGLTGDYASIETKPVANGVTVKNLKYDVQKEEFGAGKNGLSSPENLKNFTPFKYNGSNIEEVLDAKEKNARWLTNLIWEAGEKGEDALKKLFFNADQIEGGQKILGYLSPLKQGEIIIFGLGRPDTQKGFPISTGAAVDFFKREDISDELKSKVKFIFGAGKWNEGHPHYKAIERDIKTLETLDGGKYKHNMMYIDGFTPNRLNMCAHFGAYTSEFEMFGITPIEAKAAASPSCVTATGGFLDYTIDGVNGFTTKDVVMGKPEKYGLTYNDPPEKLEKARIDHQIPQVSDNYKRMIELYTNDYDGYVDMCKRNIDEKVGWNNNDAYNHGKSANRRYLEDIFETDKGWKARFQGPMKKLAGSFGFLKPETKQEKSIFSWLQKSVFIPVRAFTRTETIPNFTGTLQTPEVKTFEKSTITIPAKISEEPTLTTDKPVEKSFEKPITSTVSQTVEAPEIKLTNETKFSAQKPIEVTFATKAAETKVQDEVSGPVEAKVSDPAQKPVENLETKQAGAPAKQVDKVAEKPIVPKVDKEPVKVADKVEERTIAKTVTETVEKEAKKVKVGSAKVVAGLALGAIAVGSGVYALVRNGRKAKKDAAASNETKVISTANTAKTEDTKIKKAV